MGAAQKGQDPVYSMHMLARWMLEERDVHLIAGDGVQFSLTVEGVTVPVARLDIAPRR